MSESVLDDYFKAVERDIEEQRAASEKARADRATDRQRTLALLLAHEWPEVVATMKRITHGKTVDDNRFRFVNPSVLLGAAMMEVEQFRDEYKEPEYRAVFRALTSFELTTEARFLPILKADGLRWRTCGLGVQNEQSSAELAASLLKALCELYKVVALDSLARSARGKGL